jgi:hypothetical protein
LRKKFEEKRGNREEKGCEREQNRRGNPFEEKEAEILGHADQRNYSV